MSGEYDGAGVRETPTNRAAGVVRAGASYALFALGIAALASFFAPFVGLPGLAWHTSTLPTIAAPTEGDAIVNATPLILGVVTASVAVWLR